MAGLGGVLCDGFGVAMGMDCLHESGVHVVFPFASHRHSAHRRTVIEIQGRCLPGIPKIHERIHPLAPEISRQRKENSMNTSSMQKSKMIPARPDREKSPPIPFWERLLVRNLLPDAIIRIGIRRFLRNRLDLEKRGGLEAQHSRLLELIEDLKRSPIAIQTDMANSQHYEIPARFYECCLGKRLKYSCGFWKDDAGNLDQAEDSMLDITVTRAELADGQSILELGCGWGSLSLWMAERFPNAQILAVSNSRSQKQHIDSQAKLRGLENLQVMTVDMNVFETDRVFDRVVSVEMFEHMRNYQSLMENISRWLSPSGWEWYFHTCPLPPDENHGWEVFQEGGAASPAMDCLDACTQPVPP